MSVKILFLNLLRTLFKILFDDLLYFKLIWSEFQDALVKKTELCTTMCSVWDLLS